MKNTRAFLEKSRDRAGIKPGKMGRKAGAKGFFRAALLGLALSVVAAGPSWAAVGATKHNFGSFSPGAVTSAETSEICVFCHTPHNSNPAGPIWNRQDSGATYNVYESQTLAATLSPNAPALGQPVGSSKLCLSCHDGTVAIGSLLNLPGKGLEGTLTVTGANIDLTGKLSPSAAAYIGVDLRDDHPISFEYSLSFPSNPELKAPGVFLSRVKLDAAGKVQCTSCHDPHGTAYPKFMVASLDNGSLCASCHEKRYWNTMPSVHGTSTAVWNGNGQNPWHEDLGAPGFADDTPALQSCLACHRSHNGKAMSSLLRGINPSTGKLEDEEWTCLNCHNGNVAAKNVEPAFSYLYKHDVKGVSGRHIPSRNSAANPVRESAANLGLNRHAECADCHNGHALKSGNHAVGGPNGNVIGPNLLGGWGVKPTPWGAAGSSALTYTHVDFTSALPGADNIEGYLCLKCHSYFAYGSLPPDVPSGNADNTLIVQSDPTADFNINNMSYHPVFAQGKNAPVPTANPAWNLNTLGLTNTFRYVDFPGIGARTGFYNVTHDSAITCTDCHASDKAGDTLNPDPQGSHGSFNKWILRNNETGFGSLKTFCYNCHRRDVYGDEGYVGPAANMSRVPHPVDGLGASSPFYAIGAGLGNDGNKFGILCLTCHGGSFDAASRQLKGVHGSNAAAGAGLPGSNPLGQRMMNGACVDSYVKATTTTGAHIKFRAVGAPSTDPVCNHAFSEILSGAVATYDY